MNNLIKIFNYLRWAILKVCLASPFIFSSEMAHAAWPERPIKIIVSASHAGAADITARLIANGMQESLGVPIVIENRTCGGPNIGLALTARANPDGYTIGFSTIAFVINPSLYEKLPFDALNVFIFIAELSTAPSVLLVRRDSGIASIKDFVTKARADQSKFNVSTPAIGTPPHLQTEVLKQWKNLPGIATVVVGGGGEAVASLISGQIQLCSGVLATAHGQIKAGVLSALAVSSGRRWHDPPDVPTMADAGIKDFEFDNYTALVAPAKLPASISERIKKAALDAVQRVEISSKLIQGGSAVVALGGRRHAQRVAKKIPIFRSIITSSKIEQLKSNA